MRQSTSTKIWVGSFFTILKHVVMFVCAMDLLWRTCGGLWSVLEHSYLCLQLAWWQRRWQWVAVEHSFSAPSWDHKQMAGWRVKAYLPASKPPFSSREYHHTRVLPFSSREYHHTRVLLLIDMQYFVWLHNRLYSSGSVFFTMLKNSSLLTARKNIIMINDMHASRARCGEHWCGEWSELYVTKWNVIVFIIMMIKIIIDFSINLLCELTVEYIVEINMLVLI